MTTNIALEPELESLLQEGVREAAYRDEPLTTLRLLRFLLTSDPVRTAVAAAGASADAVMAATNQALVAGVANAADDARIVEHVLTRAVTRVLESGGARATVTDVFIALSEATDWAGGALLAAHGVTPLQLKLHVSHQPPQPSVRAGVLGLARRLWSKRPSERPAPGPDEPVQILMHDDPFTTKAFVVEILERHFAATPEAAEALMAQIHRGGPARIAELPHVEAVRRIDEITRVARERGYPLRLSIDATPADLPRAELRRR